MYILIPSSKLFSLEDCSPRHNLSTEKNPASINAIVEWICPMPFDFSMPISKCLEYPSNFTQNDLITLNNEFNHNLYLRFKTQIVEHSKP